MNLESGAFGDPTDTETLYLFWTKMEALHYPEAGHTKKYFEEKLAREQAQAKQAMQLQQMQMRQAQAQQGMKQAVIQQAQRDAARDAGMNQAQDTPAGVGVTI